jgi:hypothetical protein
MSSSSCCNSLYKPVLTVWVVNGGVKAFQWGGAKEGQFGLRALERVALQIASTFQGALAVRPITGLLLLFGCEACPALIEAVAFTIHFQNVHVVS